ncbi:MAG: nucleotidyltransferase domain-containing protein [Chloroflexi bacterium]|nr:nucleotidyltransferase domain-containing protein [Chloroflexota bacterium]MCI0580254.1 nucleotidyltransferase domain-containing protein [Chloroflexota bacterium]MCI0648106.1 nucleotidyltransferase domain-containing protein [Chloroflexota bacterium]MCI0729053.1 nucleotidyltransferase domain-containing protein [Chloroflexota bacterium]
MIALDRLRAEVQRQPYPLLFVTISGAHLYGFPSPDSDYDLRGVHILPAEQVLGLHPPEETIEQSHEREGLQFDIVTHDARKFFLLLLKTNGYVLEQLFSPLIVYTTPEHETLKAIAQNCVTRHHVHHYLGFARSQWRLFEAERPPRVKPLLYVYRVLLTGIHLMHTGRVVANLVELNDSFRLPYIPDLIERKMAGPEKSLLDEVDTSFHHGEYERLSSLLEEAGRVTSLPDQPGGKPALSDLLVRLRLLSIRITK